MAGTAAQPSITPPGPLKGAEIGTFAHYTVVVRLPDIARRTLAENEFPPEVVSGIETLIQEIPGRQVRPLADIAAPDAAEWKRYLHPYPGMDWLQVPWLFAEHYFYRRILEATGYFLPGSGQGIDPYAYQKQAGLQAGLDSLRDLTAQVNTWLQEGRWDTSILGRLISTALWGNQVDLSLWPVGKKDAPHREATSSPQAHLLADDTQAIAGHLASLKGRPSRLDFLIDNAGFELACDLCLVDYLLSSGTVRRIVLHLKAHPTFVSDAIARDVHYVLTSLASGSDANNRDLAIRLEAALEQGHLELRQDYFWNSPLPLWEMPSTLRRELALSDLVIAKGDAHYRRLLGDRHWLYTTPLPEISAYFPAPMAILRTCKSEVIAGLQPGQAEELSHLDPNWMIDGRWGLIQLVQPIH